MPAKNHLSDDDHTPVVLPVGKVPGYVLGPLVERFGGTGGNILVGPGLGKDAAAIIPEGIVVIKTDPITFATDRAPNYLVHVNANDLGCLGAKPRYLVVTALLPEGKTTAGMVEQLFEELSAATSALEIDIIGGHIEITAGLDRLILVGTMIGEVDRADLLHPGGARPGDVLVLSKPIAIEGTAVLAQERFDTLSGLIDRTLLDRALQFLDDPGISILPDAQFALAHGGVTALHDPTEGGLVTGVRELAAASGCGVIIDRDPVIYPETLAICGALGIDPLGLLASGSLLMAIQPDVAPGLIAEAKANGLAFGEIGRLVEPVLGFVRQRGEATEALHSSSWTKSPMLSLDTAHRTSTSRNIVGRL